MAITRDMILNSLKICSKKIIESKEILDDLDRPIGDSDHGVNMARGFTLVSEKLNSMEDQSIYEILNTIAMILISNVGGASGPLYGTAFMKAAKETKGKDILNADDFISIFDAVITGIKLRGKSDLGCKTMLDAIIPASEAFKISIAKGNSLKEAAISASEAADQGVEYTKTIIATKGRASYLGERSLGHQDPGATSSAMMIKIFAQKK